MLGEQTAKTGMPNVNGTALRELASSNQLANRAFQVLAQRQRKRTEITTEVMMSDLDATRSQVIGLFKDMAAAGCGRMVIGRGSKSTRFLWAYTMASVGQYALGQSDVLEPMPDMPSSPADDGNLNDDTAALIEPAGDNSGRGLTGISAGVVKPAPVASGGAGQSPTLLMHNFPLRPGLLARLSLPDDLTAQEAERLGGFIRALAAPAR